MSMNRAAAGPEPDVAGSAVMLGEISLGAGSHLSQGLVVRSRGGAVSIGNHSAVLENGAVIGWPEHPVKIGQRTVFGHRCQVLGARVGDLCEIGNGSIIMPGALVGSGVILGEGTLVGPDMVIPDETVLVGRPPHVLRTASPADRARVAALREHQTGRTSHPQRWIAGGSRAGADMGSLYEFRGRTPMIAATARLFESAEITGDVKVGEESIIGAGVKIIGDSHGPIRIGARVQVLENTVLHLLPDNELVLEDDVLIGPGAMIHGCHIEAGTVIEPAAIVCDGSRVGRESIVRAGACVKQRARIPARAIADGFPASVVAMIGTPPQRPGWALEPADLISLRKIR
jgi:carbonic anhydrase/acetyltransferase-like protein (isoleucine patch superfamily)